MPALTPKTFFFLFCFQSHRLDISSLRHTILKLGILNKLHQQLFALFLVWTVLANLSKAAAIGFSKLNDDAIPFCRLSDAHHAGTVYLLVGPEGIANVCIAHCLAEVSLPLVGIVTDFTHIHRQLGLVAEVDNLLDGCLGGFYQNLLFQDCVKNGMS